MPDGQNSAHSTGKGTWHLAPDYRCDGDMNGPVQCREEGKSSMASHVHPRLDVKAVLSGVVGCGMAAAGGVAMFGLENGGIFVVLATSIVAAMLIGARWALLGMPAAAVLGGILFFVVFRALEPLATGGFDVFDWNLFWAMVMAVPSVVGAVIGLWARQRIPLGGSKSR